MRAWQVQGAGEPIDVLHLVDVDPPVPAAGQVRIRVTAAGVGLPDVFMCRGNYPLTPGLPFTPGQEAVGVVTAVGDGVRLSVGDRVMGVSMFYIAHGSFADECLMSAETAFAVPAGLTDAEAAGFWIPHLTAWVGLVERGGITPGDVLAVLGASGGSGIAAVQLGKALGARVIAVVGDEAKAEFCRGLGADVAIDRRAGPLADALRAATDGRGVDLLYDPVGGAAAEDAVRALARGGRLLAIGFASGRWPVIDIHDLVMTNTSIIGVIAGGLARRELDKIHAALEALVLDGRLRNAVTGQVAFDDLPAALQLMADGGVVGKRVVLP
jgi:NADPH2:quinone reductase